MKSLHFTFAFVLLLLLTGCSGLENKSPATKALRFRWDAPNQFQVAETIQKNGNKFKILHHCELIQTNEEFELHWLDAKIIEVNGEKLADSDELKRAMEPLQALFLYPSFRLNQDGQFIETIIPEEYTKISNQMLDAVVTNRTEESRKQFANFSKSETGRQLLNQFSESIWQTWVENWTDVVLADGESRAVNGTIGFLGAETPVIERITNLGSTNENIVRLRYEQDFTGTNLASGMNDFINKIAEEMEDKAGAEPITNQFTIKRQTILEVETERQTLKPHWAKRTTTAVISTPEEKPAKESEIREYNFSWSDTNGIQFKKQP